MTTKEKDYINFLEKIGSDVHPALKQQNVDGWICNFAEGYSRRANSVLPFDWGRNREENIKTCESLYAQAGLPCIFKMTEASASGLQELLKKNGYKSEAPTDVMTVDCNSIILQKMFETIEEPEEIGVIITSSPDEAWLNPFFEYENRTDLKTMDIAKRQFELINQNENLTALYCRIQILGNDVAVASAVIKDGILFLMNVVVKPECRGKGYGKILVKELLENACDMGAETLCLQVVQNNSVAINMYKKFGFKYLYTYWYMVRK